MHEMHGNKKNRNSEANPKMTVDSEDPSGADQSVSLVSEVTPQPPSSLEHVSKLNAMILHPAAAQ